MIIKRDKPSAAELLRQHTKQPTPEWYDVAREALDRHQLQREQQRDEERRRQEHAELQQMTDAEAVHAAIHGRPRDPATPLPLNGAAVLRAALAGIGSAGTVNGQ